MATIKDVAKYAGVSIGTVSNVLNGKTVSHGDTYEKVINAAKVLNYHPNFSARNLRYGKNRMIGVLLPTMDSPYNDIVRGVFSSLKNSQFYPVIRYTQNNRLVERTQIRNFLNMGVAGLIVVPVETELENTVFSEIQDNMVRTVLIERNIADLECDKIFFDNTRLSEEASLYFKKKYKKENIALIRQEQPFSCDDDIQRGFLSVNPQANVIFVDSEKDILYEQLLRIWRDRDEPIEAILASDVLSAVEAHEVCHLYGWSPEIKAFGGNIGERTIYGNAYSIIQRNAVEMGIKAVEFLLSSITEENHLYKDYFVSPIYENVAYTPVFSWKKQTIRILGLVSNGTDAIELLSRGFEKESAISLEIEKRDYNNLREEIEKEMNRPTCTYDLIMVDKPWIPTCNEGNLLLELDNDFKESMLSHFPYFMQKAFCNENNKLYGIPIIAGIQAIYYRKDIFNDREYQDKFRAIYGRSLSEPQNWGEYNQIAEFFTKANNPYSPFEWGTAISSMNPIGLVDEFIPRQWAFGGRIVSHTQMPALLSDSNVRALNNLYKTSKCSDPKLFGITKDEDVFQQLLDGQVPIVCGFANHFCMNQSQGKTFEHFIDACKVPRGKAMFSGYILGINQRSVNIDICKELLQWMTCDPFSVSSMRMNGCLLTNAVLSNTDLQLRYPWLTLVEETYNKGGVRKNIYTNKGKLVNPNVIDVILGNALHKKLTDKEDTISVLKEADDYITELLAN